jgi:hypothetical protein
MAQTTLIPPDSHTKLPTTRDENAEMGWSFKRVTDYINTMMGELYGYETARLAAEALVSPHKVLDVTISSAEVLALFTTPIAILAAPGAGFTNIVDGIAVSKAAGTAYAGVAAGEDLSFSYTDASGLAIGGCETTGFLDQATVQMRYVPTYRAASGISSIVAVENAAIVAHLLVGNIITGTSPLRLRIFYRTIPTTF